VDVQQLETTSQTFTRPDGTQYTNVGIRFANSKRIYNPIGGEIKGLYDSRDIYIPEYESWLDTLALGLVDKVNTQHLLGFNLMGYNGFNFFDPLTTGASDINVSASIASDVKNIAAALAQATQPAITNIAAAGALDFGNTYQLTIDGVPSTGTADPDNAKNLVQGTVIVSVGGTVLTENVDYNVNYITGVIQMLHNGYDGNAVSIDFDYNTGDFAGPGDNANAVEISKLRHALTMEPDALGNPTATFDQYYGAFIGRLGFARNEAASNLETRQFLVDQYEAHQDSIAGVSLDEEMAELIKFEHTYQACARIISTADAMLDVLMNM
jgi:flagellar hook-associated protein FlgK